MWQEIAIILIGILVILYVGRKLYRLLTRPQQKDNPCCGCTGCSLKKKYSK
ncbi:MAG: FeoB-associated Cys-rich membrane protein [Parabacteroides sp.]|nr:FeoB-associated Cys-rich membrane protein [Parabacteroides sp.]